MAPMPPTLLVVSGPPATGKTTLAHALARALHCPAICRDEIKEGLVSGAASGSFVPQRGDAANLAATAAFFDVVELLIRRGVTLVAEAAFQHHRWAPRLTALTASANIRVITCEASDAVVRDRRRRRWRNEPWRRRFHADSDPDQLRSAEQPEDAPASYEPIRLKLPVLAVDTSDGYRPAFEEIVAFAVD